LLHPAYFLNLTGMKQNQTLPKKRFAIFQSFVFAISGLIKAFLLENNMKIHFVAASASVALGIWLHIGFLEWAMIVICIAMVISFELMNTAVEKICDRISTEIHPLTKLIKDISAAAVLVVSLASLVTGLLIFVPKLLNQIYSV
jgi:diacylglycerol kinase